VSKDRYEFTVEGTDNFPFDMLRYDSCYPRDQESAVAIGRNRFYNPESIDQPRRVNLVSTYHGPTNGRWQSFGWKVVEYRRTNI